MFCIKGEKKGSSSVRITKQPQAHKSSLNKGNNQLILTDIQPSHSESNPLEILSQIRYTHRCLLYSIVPSHPIPMIACSRAEDSNKNCCVKVADCSVQSQHYQIEIRKIKIQLADGSFNLFADFIIMFNHAALYKWRRVLIF